MRRNKATLTVLLGALLSLGPIQGVAAQAGGFDFAGENCSQFVTNLQVDAAKVRPYVPDRFVFSRDAIGKAAVGYRIHACPQMTVDGTSRGRVIWSELGVRIMAPDGRLPDHVDGHVIDGHDYYMLSLHANDSKLAAAMKALGLPSARVPVISYDLRLNPLGGTLSADETVPEEGRYQVRLRAFTSESPPAPDFEIRSWYLGRRGLVRYSDHRTAVTARLSQIDIHADPETLLARLTGETDTRTYDALVSFATSSLVERGRMTRECPGLR